MCLVQATEDPPDSILPMSHGDVVVTRHKKPKEVKDPSRVLLPQLATMVPMATKTHGSTVTHGEGSKPLPKRQWQLMRLLA